MLPQFLSDPTPSSHFASSKQWSIILCQFSPVDALRKKKETCSTASFASLLFLSTDSHFFYVPKEDLKCHEKTSKIVVMVYFFAPIITEINPTKQLGNKRINEKLCCIQMEYICTRKLKRALPATIQVKDSGRCQSGKSGGEVGLRNLQGMADTCRPPASQKFIHIKDEKRKAT